MNVPAKFSLKSYSYFCTKKTFAISVLAASVSMNVQAANYAEFGGTIHKIDGDAVNNLAIAGKINNVGSEKNNLAIGDGALIDPSQKVDARFEQAIAIGIGGTKVTGSQSIAIGGDTHAKGYASVVIGGDDADVVYSKTVKIKYSNPDFNGNNEKEKTTNIDEAFHNLTGNYIGGKVLEGQELADWIKKDTKNREWQVGDDNKRGIKTFEHRFQTSTADHLGVVIGVKSVAGVLSLALGTAARAEKTNALAIGTGATATLDNAVALGGGSNTKQAGTKQSGVDFANMKFRWAGGDRVLEGDIISFGSEGYERQLKHVAPGEVSETSTDAINGSQLWSITRDVVDRIDVPNSIKTTVRTNGGDTTNSATTVYVAALDDDAKEKARLIEEETGKLAYELKKTNPAWTKDWLENELAKPENVKTINDRVQSRYDGRFATAKNVADMINAAGFSTAIGNDTSDFADQNYVDQDGNKLTKAAAINAGDAVKFNSGKNLRIQQKVTAATDKTPEQIEFTYALSDQIDLGDKGTITLGGTTTKEDGKDPVTKDAIIIGKNGINAGNKTISGVKDGVDGKDAVNVDQLKKATAKGAIEKDTAKLGAVKVKDLTDEQKQQAKIDAIAKELAKQTGNENKTEAELKELAKSEINQPEYKELGDKAVEEAKNNKLATVGNIAEMINAAGFTTTIGEKDIKGGAKTSVIDADGNAIVDAAKQKSTINAGDTVKFNAGQNLRIEQKIVDDNNVEFTYALAKDVTLNDGSLIISKTETTGTDAAATTKTVPVITINSNGINAGGTKIKGVAAGTDDSDAVNVSQLKMLENKVGASTERGTIESNGTGVKFKPLAEADKQQIKDAETAKVEAAERKRLADEYKKANPMADDSAVNAYVDDKITEAMTAKAADIQTATDNAIKTREQNQLATAKNVAEMIKHATERGSISEDATAPGKVTASLTDAQKTKIEETAKKAAQAAGESDPEKLKQAAKDAVTAAETANKEKLASVGNVAEMINAAGFNATIGNDTKDFTDQKGKAEASINAGDDVIFQSGKNLKVKQEITTLDDKDTVKFTYALSDNVDLGDDGRLTLGGTTTKGADGKSVTTGGIM